VVTMYKFFHDKGVLRLYLDDTDCVLDADLYLDRFNCNISLCLGKYGQEYYKRYFGLFFFSFTVSDTWLSNLYDDEEDEE
jgi:hypothetical protein